MINEMSYVMSFLFYQLLENDLVFFLKELKVLVLSIWCSSLGPNGRWRDAVCTVHFAEKERIRWAKEGCVRPGGRVQPWPLLGDRQKKAQHVHWSERGEKKCWMVSGYVIVIWSLIIIIFFKFYFITKKPLNISHHTTSQHRPPTTCSGFLIISSDLNSEGLAKLLLAVLYSLFKIGKMGVLFTAYLFGNRKCGCPLELSALFSILRHKGETSGGIQ